MRDQTPGTRILIVDDHPMVRRGIAQLLAAEADFVVCAEAETREEALRALADSDPNLAVVHLTLQGCAGLDLLAEMHAHRPGVHILALGMYDETAYAERVLRVGAAGYVVSQEATEHLVEAIRRVLAGRTYLSDSLAKRVRHRRGAADAEASGPDAAPGRL